MSGRKNLFVPSCEHCALAARNYSFRKLVDDKCENVALGFGSKKDVIFENDNFILSRNWMTRYQFYLLSKTHTGDVNVILRAIPDCLAILVKVLRIRNFKVIIKSFFKKSCFLVGKPHVSAHFCVTRNDLMSDPLESFKIYDELFGSGLAKSSPSKLEQPAGKNVLEVPIEYYGNLFNCVEDFFQLIDKPIWFEKYSNEFCFFFDIEDAVLTRILMSYPSSRPSDLTRYCRYAYCKNDMCKISPESSKHRQQTSRGYMSLGCDIGMYDTSRRIVERDVKPIEFCTLIELCNDFPETTEYDPLAKEFVGIGGIGFIVNGEVVISKVKPDGSISYGEWIESSVVEIERFKDKFVTH